MSQTTLEPLQAPPKPIPSRRRRKFPWPPLLVMLGALLVGVLLNAEALLQTARSQEPGWQREATVAVMTRVTQLSGALGLDAPRRWLDRAVGRGEVEVVDGATRVPVTALPPVTTQGTTATTTPPAETTETPPATTGIPGVFTPTPDRPARLWVTGDSLTESFGPALVNLAAATEVIDPRHEVHYSTGLTRPDFFDWPAYLTEQLDLDPVDILVFMVGANDGQPIATEEGWVDLGTAAWAAEYRRRVGATMDLLTTMVPTVYWIGQPIARDAGYAEKMALMDEIYRTEAARRSNVRYVDTWELFADDSGAYSAYLPDASGTDVLMRRSDGIHLTPAGGEYLARAVLDVIAGDWPLP